MASQPEFESDDADANARKAERKPFDASVQFRIGDRRAVVTVRDISISGARVAGVFRVREGDRLFIKLPSIEPLEAEVAWVEEFQFGCKFLRPLNEFVFEAILRNA